MAKKNYSAKPLFDNGVIVAPDNQFLGYCSNNRLNWYLDRNLAEIVEYNPLKIRLKFEPSGRRGANDAWLNLAKPNLCVVCGTTENLSRHHVIPYAIIKHMPPQYKEHNSHDIMALCLPCHEAYEKESFQKRKTLAKKLNIDLVGFDHDKVLALRKMRGDASVILTHGNKMPKERREFLLNRIASVFGKIPNEEELIIIIDNLDPMLGVKIIKFGQQYVELIGDNDAIAIEWRQHFIDTMNPKFMPMYWEVNRKFA